MKSNLGIFFGELDQHRALPSILGVIGCVLSVLRRGCFALLGLVVIDSDNVLHLALGRLRQFIGLQGIF